MLLIVVVLPPKLVINDPPKYRLAPEELGMMESTWADAPDSPKKGVGDHELAFVS